MTTYTSSLRMILPDSGALVNTWGTVLNASLINLIDSSIAGYTSITMSDADYTLTTANGSGDQARSAFLNFTGTNTAIRNVLAPAVSKEYVVSNNTTGGFSIVIKISGGAGVTVPNGYTMKVWSDGVNFYEAVRYLGAPYIGTLNVTGNATIGGSLIANGGIVFSGNFTGSAASSAYTIAGGSTYNNGGSIALYGSAASGSPGTIAFSAGTGTTNNLVGSFNAAGTFNVVNNATIGGTLGVTGASTFSSPLTITNQQPLIWNNPSGGADAKIWAANASTNVLNFYASNDASSATTTWLQVTRSGYGVTSVSFPAGAISAAGALAVSGTFTSTGAATLSGGATVPTVLTASGTSGAQSSAFIVSNATGSNYGAAWYMNNSSGGATNPNKWFRINPTGDFQIVNNSYTSIIFSVSDAGNVSFTGNLSATGGVVTLGNTTFNGTVTATSAGTNLASTQISSLGVGTGATGTAGQIVATNNITAYYSDNRLKTRFENIPNALDSVKKLNGFYYEANATAQALGYEAKREIGVSAQEVEAIYPEIVAPAPIDNQYLTVHYERLVPILIEAIKELTAKVEALENKA